MLETGESKSTDRVLDIVDLDCQQGVSLIFKRVLLILVSTHR